MRTRWKFNTPDAKAEAFAFVASECGRMQREVADALLSNTVNRLDRRHMFCTLPHPGGVGETMCSREGFDALADLATHALRESPFAETAELDDVFAALRRSVSARFLSHAELITSATANAVLSDALADAAAKQRDTLHYLPCRLMYARDPDIFVVGPVTFRARERFDADMASSFESYVRRRDDERARQFDEKSVKHCRDYYEAFGWTADVTVLGCAPTISKQRAFLAVQSAINMLALLFGNHHARRMTVGGPQIAEMDKRAHITSSTSGELFISTSTGSSSASGFEDGWGDFFQREDVAPLLEAGGRALMPIVNPALAQPLAARFIDAITWFGEAVRETSPASQVVKSVTAIEHLVLAGRTSNIETTVANRAAMLHADYEDTDFFALRKEMTAYYKLRSALAHGQRSPFDPEVADAAPSCMKFVEDTLLAGLALFHSTNVLEHALTNETLATGYDQLVEHAEQRAKARWATRPPT